MRLKTPLTALSTLLTIVTAFQNTSPFFAILPNSIPATHLRTSFSTPDKLANLTHTLSTACPSDIYVIVSQPGISSTDLQPASSPHLKRRLSALESSTSQSLLAIPHVVGALDAAAIATSLSHGCHRPLIRLDGSSGAAAPSIGQKGAVIQLDFPVPNSNAATMRRHDEILHSVFSSLPQGEITVLYVTTPRASNDLEDENTEGHQSPLQVDFDADHALDEPLHMAWTRDTEAHIPKRLRRRDDDGASKEGGAPLFETYAFFSPAIFMGGFALVILGAILGTALNAVAGIEVSYGSFNKEMVQAMSKGQKQT